MERRVIIISLFVIGVCCIVFADDNTTNESGLLNATTIYSQDSSYRCDRGVIPLVQEKERCCSRYQEHYRQNWYRHGLYLTGFFSTLEFWNCSNFAQVCEGKTYAFNDFTNLVYDHFCSPENLQIKCYDTINAVVYSGQGTNDTGSASDTWDELISALDPNNLDFNELKEPCVAIALFNRPSGGVGRFHEIVEPFVPFCDLVWTGYDIDTTMEGEVSVWKSISPGCQAGIIVAMTLNVIFGGAVIIANITIIAVYLNNVKLRNSQAIYKISIALGDLIVGVLVFPCTVAFQYWSIFSPSKMGEIVLKEADENATSSTLATRKSGGGNDFLSTELVMSIGFFTTSSILVSMYTLLTASFDRFRAVYRPLSYDKNTAKRHAKYWCIGVWLTALAVACVPTFVPDLEYKLIVTSIVTPEGEAAIIFLAVAFLLPLVVLWGFNIATYRAAMGHAKRRRKMLTSCSTDKMEAKLARTLALMVGVFSACTVPAIVILILPHVLSNINFNQPKKVNLTDAKIFNSLEYCGTFILLTNCLWNCLIYSLRGKNFKIAAKELYSKLATTLLLDRLCTCKRLFASSARRVSDATSDNTKKTDSSPLPGVDFSSPTYEQNKQGISSSTFKPKEESVSTSVKETSGFEPSLRESEQHNVQIVSEVPDFGSFAIDAVGDRFFVSVMDDIEEL